MTRKSDHSVRRDLDYYENECVRLTIKVRKLMKEQKTQVAADSLESCRLTMDSTALILRDGRLLDKEQLKSLYDQTILLQLAILPLVDK